MERPREDAPEAQVSLVKWTIPRNRVNCKAVSYRFGPLDVTSPAPTSSAACTACGSSAGRSVVSAGRDRLDALSFEESPMRRNLAPPLWRTTP